MKSNYLIKEIQDGKIKEGTKIHVSDILGEKCVIRYQNKRLEWVSGQFDTADLCNKEIDFEIEKPRAIEQIEFTEGTYTGDKIEIIKDRVNEVIRHINEGIQETEFPF